MITIKFYKYHGNGNDFILIDSRNSKLYIDFLKNNYISQIKKLCNRNFGIGADGLIFILDPENNDNDAKMLIYNSDNSEAEMCGNGIRCLIQFLYDSDFHMKEKINYKIETKAGLKIGEYKSNGIMVRMGKPILENHLIPTKINNFKNQLPYSKFTINGFEKLGYAVGMGNPHLVFFLDDLDSVDINIYGPLFEYNDLFPEKTNVHFCKIIDQKIIKVKVWERGSGQTLACGTGACAVHTAAYKLGLCSSNTTIKLPGGDLIIDWANNSEEVKMTGTSSRIFDGSISLN